MSGLFQRLSRRRTDAAQEPAPDATFLDRPAADAAGEQPTAVQPPVAPASEPPPAGDQPTAAQAPLDQPTAAQPPLDQPTEVQAPLEEPAAAPPVEQPTVEGAAASAALARATAPGGPDDAAGDPAGEAGAPAPAAGGDAAAAGAAGQPTDAGQPAEAAPTRPGFRERGRMRRRLRYLRRVRELQLRDLGGLVFDLRRYERKRDDLVAQKIDQLRACDDELRALEQALDERRDVRDVRAPGIGGTCPRCFALFGSSDRFCASCGAALRGGQGPAQVAPAPPPPPPAPAGHGGAGPDAPGAAPPPSPPGAAPQ